VKEIPVSPFRVFGAAARPSSSPARVVLFWNRLPVQSFGPVRVSPLLLLRSRYAVSALPRLCGFPLADCCRRLFRLPATSSLRASPSSRVLPSVTYPTAAAIRSSHGLWFPTALEVSEVHLPRDQAFPLRSAFRVWLPSWRLTPSNPVPVLFHTGGALGIHPSEVSPLGVSHSLSTERNPRTVGSAVFLPPKRQTGLTNLGCWVRVLRKCLATARAFRPAATGASHGFLPL
jgi:hypothetical protein